VAHPSVLKKTAASELDGAVSLLQELLPEKDYPEVHDNLFRTQRDAVARSDQSYQIAVLIGALCCALKDHHQQIAALSSTKADKKK
jgi:hypothetical protein